MSEITLGGVRLTSPDKVLYEDQGITKAALAEHYLAVADRMLPHVARRPLTMVRCPAGQEQKCFYQRHAGSGVPPEIREVTIPGFEEPYLCIEDVRGLIAMVQMGVLEIHPWGVRIEEPEKPDRIIFDLDPSEGLAMADVVRAAREVRSRLSAIGLDSFVKTTGGKGLHVVVPVMPERGWDETKAFAKKLSETMAADAPDLYLTRISKAERKGRIFIDYLRNDPTSTAVAPYSTRARPGAPVATPLDWNELSPKLNPASFTLTRVRRRIAGQKSDPWAGMNRIRQRLPRPDAVGARL